MIILTVISILTIIYLTLKYIYSYWDRVGLVNIPPSIPFGNLGPTAKRTRSFGFTIYDLYKATTEPFIGIYLFFRPAILVRDPEFVRNILVTDFSSFHDRGVYCNEKRDPFSGTLISLPGAKWKALRNQLSPAFASGKIKGMFPAISEIGKGMEKYLESFARKNEIIDMKSVASRYSLDIIASVIFGLDVDSVSEPNHPFRMAVDKLVIPNKFQSLVSACVVLCPRLLDFFRISGVPSFIQKFMIDIVHTTMGHRENNDVIRKDFMQLLLQLRNTGEIKEDDNWEIQSDKKLKVKSLSIEQCAGQVFLFYIAGSETSSAAISFCLFELAQNPIYMKTLQNEIDEVLKRHDGQLSYDVLKEMKFLDLCLSETLRMYPGLPILNRECTKDFEIPGKNFTIKKGTPIVISLYGIHRDPNIFKNPDTFDPYRFEEGRKEFNENYYMPFGDGPHICIGMRMAQVVTKVALILMLSKYNFEATDQKTIVYEVGTIPIVAKGGIALKISMRNK